MFQSSYIIIKQAHQYDSPYLTGLQHYTEHCVLAYTVDTLHISTSWLVSLGGLYTQTAQMATIVPQYILVHEIFIVTRLSANLHITLVTGMINSITTISM